MDNRNLGHLPLQRPLQVADALTDRLYRAAPEDRPCLAGLPAYSVFAVFGTGGGSERFLGLVTCEQVAACPGRVLADLLPQPVPAALTPDATVAVARRRFETGGMGALAVMDRNGAFLGAVTPLSLLKAALKYGRTVRREGLALFEHLQRELERQVNHAGRMRSLQGALRQLMEAAMTAASDRDLLRTALETLVQLVEARYGAIVVAGEEGTGGDFIHCGLSPEEVAWIDRLPEGGGLLGEFLSERGSLRIGEIAAHPRAAGFPPGHPGMRTLVAAVIACQGHTYGRVYLCDRSGGPFSAEDEVLVQEFAHMLALAMHHERNQLQQRRNEVELRIAARVFESSAEGILITDADQKILMVNQALTTITGYRAEDLIGRTPSIFSSGHHDEGFYREMWRSLNETGQWQGEIWNRRKNGAVYPEWLNISALTDDDGRLTHYVAVFSDLSMLSVRRREMERLVHFDHLTDLPNRLMFRAELKQAMLRTRFNGKCMALLMLDLDRFKTINDTLGHQIGDRLLQQVSRRLQHGLRRREAPRMGDTVARLSGDEFTIILNDLDSRDDAARVAGKILRRFHQPFMLGQLERSVTASIGVAMYPDQADTLDELISQADLAMYHAKKGGRNRFQFYDASIHAPSRRRLMLENDLYNALDRCQFEIHYQPQVAVGSGRVTGLEALLRWRHPEHGLVSPGDFIPLLEETGLIGPVGQWILRSVCARYRECAHALGVKKGELTVAVNLSARQLNEDLVGLVHALLEENRLDPRWLKLELTESVAMDDPEGSMKIFSGLRDLGIEICIDDFGTGYSSLGYLRRLPIAALKIDQSFVRDMLEDPGDQEIVGAIVQLAHNLKLQVIAEGVETRAQYEMLERMGCDVIQGYLFGRPAPLTELRPPVFPSPG